MATLKPLLDAAPYAPPRVRDIAKATGVGEDAVRALLKRVARMGEAYPVAHDHYFTAAAVADLARRVATINQRDGMVRSTAVRRNRGRPQSRHPYPRILRSYRLHSPGPRYPCIARQSGAIRLMNNGRNRSPVGRTVFKTVRACQTGLGRFDSCFLPPLSLN